MTRSVKPEAVAKKRQEILDAAEHFVFTRGYEQMAIQDLLEALQISRGAFYHYFRSKQALLMALVERIAEQAEWLIHPIVLDRQMFAQDKLLRVFAVLDQYKQENKNLLFAFLRAWYADENALFRQKLYLAHVKQLAPLLERVIQHGVTEGVFTTPYLAQAARIILSLLEDLGYAIVELLFAEEGERIDTSRIVLLGEAMADTLERVLGAESGSLLRLFDEELARWTQGEQKHDDARDLPSDRLIKKGDNHMEAVSFSDLRSQETLRNPIAFYARLREREPLTSFPFGSMTIWFIATTYEETVSLLKDPRFVRDLHSVFPEGVPQARQHPFQQVGETMQLFTRNLLSLDPPDHTRLRGLVSQAFTPRMIERLRPRIQQITDDLLDAVQERGQMDLVRDFAYPLPMTVISEMLGIAPRDRDRFRDLSQALLVGASTASQEWQTTGETFIAYIRKLLASKREQPADDLTSRLLQMEEKGDKLEDGELISMIWLLIVAGHETTVNLLSNGALALLQASEHGKRYKLLWRTKDRVMQGHASPFAPLRRAKIRLPPPTPENLKLC